MKPFLMIILAAGCAVSDGSSDDELGSMEQDSLSFSSTLLNLRPVAYWRLGETSGSTMVDSSTTAANGSYNNILYPGQAGAIAGDPNTSIYFPAGSGAGWGQASSRREYSLTRGWDNFGHTTCIQPPNCGLLSTWGTSDGGDPWVAQVTTTPSYYAYGGGVIDPRNAGFGTYQMGLPAVQLVDGDLQVAAKWTAHPTKGQLQAVALVGRHVSNSNFVRAELRENPDHTLDLYVYETVGGVDNLIAAPYRMVALYNTGDWWYVRFQYEGTALRARAWVATSIEPAYWQVTTKSTTRTRGGDVAVRHANSTSGVLPKLTVAQFRAQTVGFSVHTAIKLKYPQPDSDLHWVTAFGKGNVNEWNEPGTREYHVRVFTYTEKETECPTYDRFGNYEKRSYPDCLCSMDDPVGFPSCRHRMDVKWYVFNNGGGKGPGISFGDIAPDVWNDYAMMMEPGDNLDLTAGVRGYLNGVDVGRTSGAMYHSCDLGGLCWDIYPLPAGAPVRVGTEDGMTFFRGQLDEVAIFPRLLTPTEVAALYQQTQ